MKQERRLTRLEKIAQAAAIKAGTISEPRHMMGLPPGTYTLEGAAAERLREKTLLVPEPKRVVVRRRT